LAIDAIGKPDEVWFWIAEGAYLFRPIGQLKGAFTVAGRLFTMKRSELMSCLLNRLKVFALAKR